MAVGLSSRTGEREMSEVAGAARIALSGRAIVVCPHDREKRVVTDVEQVVYLGHVAGVAYDPTEHVLHLCSCCGNLFVRLDDTPSFCEPCGGPLRHALAGPLPEPKGRIR